MSRVTMMDGAIKFIFLVGTRARVLPFTGVTLAYVVTFFYLFLIYFMPCKSFFILCAIELKCRLSVPSRNKFICDRFSLFFHVIEPKWKNLRLTCYSMLKLESPYRNSFPKNQDFGFGPTLLVLPILVRMFLPTLLLMM